MHALKGSFPPEGIAVGAWEAAESARIGVRAGGHTNGLGIRDVAGRQQVQRVQVIDVFAGSEVKGAAHEGA